MLYFGGGKYQKGAEILELNTEDVVRQFRLETNIDYSFPVIFTRGVFAEANSSLRDVVAKGSRVGVVVEEELVKAGIIDPNVFEKYFSEMEYQGHSCVPGAEQAKQGLGVVERVLHLIASWSICRHSYVVVVGGGALLDAAGLACALAHRGVRLLRVPSTALSQGDSGVGVKNGINMFGQKNFVGSFAPPCAVINDLEFLKSLPHEMLLDGVAEALKVALIKDESLFEYISLNAQKIASGDMAVLENIVMQSAHLHSAHIAEGGDPFELGGARPLDFGHWVGHKLELMSEHKLRHGEAVAIGIALDSVYASLIGLISSAELNNILQVILSCGMMVYDSRLATPGEDNALAVFAGVKEFQEHLGGKLAITLPKGIGARIEVGELDYDRMAQAIELLESFSVGGEIV